MTRTPYSEILAMVCDDMGWPRDSEGKPNLNGTEFHAARRAINRALRDLWPMAFWKELLEVLPYTFPDPETLTDVPKRVAGVLIIGRVEGVYASDPRVHRGAKRVLFVEDGEVIHVRQPALTEVWVRYLPPTPNLEGDVWLPTTTYLPDGLEDTFDMRWGTNTSETLDEAAILALVGLDEVGSVAGTRSFAAGGYKFIAWQDELGAPVAGTGFKDGATGWTMAMAGTAEGYSNMEAGWGYRTVTVSGSTWRVYRSLNQLGAAIDIIIS